MHKPLLFTLLLFGFIVMAIAQAPSISVQKLMTASEFEAAGMHKLSREELQTLDSWLVKTLMEVAQPLCANIM